MTLQALFKKCFSLLVKFRRKRPSENSYFFQVGMTSICAKMLTQHKSVKKILLAFYVTTKLSKGNG